jgi:sugar phosphate isomerase/epimerase
MRGLHAIGYDGLVGLESFEDMSPAMRSATRLWRDLAPGSDELVREGLAFLESVRRETAAGS